MRIIDPMDASMLEVMSGLFIGEKEDSQPTDEELAQCSFQHDGDETPESEAILPATPEEAKKLLIRFFADKTMHFGGPIPINRLLEDRHVEMVLRLELMVCVDIFYLCLRGHRWKVEKSLKLFFKLQEDAKKKEIPKKNSGGLLLVYLRLCKGYDV